MFLHDTMIDLFFFLRKMGRVGGGVRGGEEMHAFCHNILNCIFCSDFKQTWKGIQKSMHFIFLVTTQNAILHVFHCLHRWYWWPSWTVCVIHIVQNRSQRKFIDRHAGKQSWHQNWPTAWQDWGVEKLEKLSGLGRSRDNQPWSPEEKGEWRKETAGIWPSEDRSNMYLTRHNCQHSEGCCLLLAS